MEDLRYRPDAPSVISETLDGETVIMDLRSGTYFSTRGVGALIWTWLEQGATIGQVASGLAMLRDGEPELVASTLDPFVRELAGFNLIVADPDRQPNTVLPTAPAELVYSPPVLSAYTDMEDLLQLDPVHDVDAETGWPVPRPQTGQIGGAT